MLLVGLPTIVGLAIAWWWPMQPLAADGLTESPLPTIEAHDDK